MKKFMKALSAILFGASYASLFSFLLLIRWGEIPLPVGLGAILMSILLIVYTAIIMCEIEQFEKEGHTNDNH